MEKQRTQSNSYFSNVFNIYKKNFIQGNINKLNNKITTTSHKKFDFSFSILNHIKEPYLFSWGFVIYLFPNVTGYIKYFNIIKEKNYGLGETMENILKTNKINKMSLASLGKFLSNSFLSINGLIFRPGIMIPKTFIYFSGLFQFYNSKRTSIKDYLDLLFTSFVLTIPFYHMLDNFILYRLKFSRIEENNLQIKNLKKMRVLSNTLYAFIDNFLLNLIFFGCVDVLHSLNEKTGADLTYDTKKLEQIKKIGEENETIGRVILLNSSFIKYDHDIYNIIDYMLAGFLTSVLYSPIETLYFIMRKNLYNVSSFMKNLNNLNPEGKLINFIILKKNFRLNLFRLFICNSLNSLLLMRTIE